MSELALQSLVVDAVRGVDGFGFKLANKFLIGIPDLLLCLPGQAIGLWEVKLNDRPKKSNDITLDLSLLQQRTLSNCTDAGGYCGVISFVQSVTREISVNAFLYKTLRYEDDHLSKHIVDIGSHVTLERGHREEIIVDVLNRMWRHYGRG